MRLAVMAHYDPRGRVAPHVRRQVAALAEVADLVVVSTADLTDESRALLRGHGRLIERENEGYDFGSYAAGLAASDLSAYDEVTVCNDSAVGPLDGYARIYAAMADRPADFWGLTETDRRRHHVQSFFVTFRPAVVRSAAFGAFWSDLAPTSDRSQVIRRHEVGLSQRLYAAGFTSAAYFQESPADRRLARRRVWWWQVRRRGVPHTVGQARALRGKLGVAWNPCAALADRALDDARLPVVKVDTLRYDPYGLDAGRLLTACEARYPAAFEGVRAWLAETDAFYPPRPAEALGPVPVGLRPLRRLVDYRAR